MRAVVAALVAALCLGASPALGQEFSADDEAQVQARVAELMAVTESGDISGALDVVPPRLYRHIARRIGVTEAEVRDYLLRMTGDATAGIVVVDYAIDVEGTRPSLTPDGTRTYLLMPTVLRMRRDGQVLRSESQTLALEDEGRWWLIRIDTQQQVDLVTQIWPEFSGVDFPKGMMAAE